MVSLRTTTKNYILIGMICMTEKKNIDNPKSYKVYNIKWDCSSKETISRLPKDIEIEVPNDFQEEPEISDWLSDRISDITGWCHFGFEYEPLIDKEKFDNSPKVCYIVA